LSQSTSGSRPIYRSRHYAGVIKVTGLEYLSNTSFSLAQPNTVFVVYYGTKNLNNPSSGVDQVLYGNDAAGGHALLFKDHLTSDVDLGSLRFYAGTLVPAVTAPFSQPHVCTIEFNGASSLIRSDGTTLASSQNIGANTKSKLSLGAYANGTLPAWAMFREVIIYNRILTSTERGQVETWLMNKLQNGLTFIMWDGDSHTRGYSTTTPFGDLAYQTMQLLSERPYCWMNRAIPGQTSAQMIARATATDGFMKKNALKNILVVSIGANDFGTSVSLATLEGNISSYIAARKAAGWQKVIIWTIPPHTATGTYSQANWQALNDWLRAGSSGADVVSDPMADTRIGDWGDNTDATYYGADQVHLTDAGNAISAAVIKTAIEGVLP